MKFACKLAWCIRCMLYNPGALLLFNALHKFKMCVSALGMPTCFEGKVWQVESVAIIN